MTETTGINAPMRSSITKQTLYEFDEQSTNVSAATSEENISQLSSSKEVIDPNPADKLSCSNLDQISKAYTNSTGVLNKENPSLSNTMKHLNFSGQSKKTSGEKQVSFKEQEMNKTNQKFIPKHKPTNSMDSGFVDVEKENNNRDEVKLVNNVKDEGLGSSPPSAKLSELKENCNASDKLEHQLKVPAMAKLSLNLKEPQMKQVGHTKYSRSLAKSPSAPTFPMSETSHMPTTSGSVYLPTEQGTSDQYYSSLEIKSPLKDELSFAQTRHYAQSPMAVQFRELSVSANPYMSPLTAEDDMLVGLPPVYFVVSERCIYSIHMPLHFMCAVKSNQMYKLTFKVICFA